MDGWVIGFMWRVAGGSRSGGDDPGLGFGVPR